MASREGAGRAEATLLALLEHEERLARWESLPAEARRQAVEQLAQLLLKVTEAEREGAGSDQAAAP